MGIITKLFGTTETIDSIKIKDLKFMEIKLNHKIDELQGEVRTTESEIIKLFEKAKTARSKSEEVSIAMRIKTVSQRKEMKLAAQAKLDKELRAISNILIFKEHQKDLEAVGVWEHVKKIKPDDLEDWIIGQKMDAQNRDNLVSSIIRMTSDIMMNGVEQEDDLGDIMSVIRAVKEGDLDPEEAKEVTSESGNYRSKDYE